MSIPTYETRTFHVCTFLEEDVLDTVRQCEVRHHADPGRYEGEPVWVELVERACLEGSSDESVYGPDGLVSDWLFAPFNLDAIDDDCTKLWGELTDQEREALNALEAIRLYYGSDGSLWLSHYNDEGVARRDLANEREEWESEGEEES